MTFEKVALISRLESFKWKFASQVNSGLNLQVLDFAHLHFNQY